jgi:hypothetical protein
MPTQPQLAIGTRRPSADSATCTDFSQLRVPSINGKDGPPHLGKREQVPDDDLSAGADGEASGRERLREDHPAGHEAAIAPTSGLAQNLALKTRGVRRSSHSERKQDD